MSIFSKIAAAIYRSGLIPAYPRYSPDEAEPAGSYEEYLAQGPASKDGLSNSRNLFDDSNAEDTYWLNIARKSLRNG